MCAAGLVLVEDTSPAHPYLVPPVRLPSSPTTAYNKTAPSWLPFATMRSERVPNAPQNGCAPRRLSSHDLAKNVMRMVKTFGPSGHALWNVCRPFVVVLTVFASSWPVQASVGCLEAVKELPASCKPRPKHSDLISLHEVAECFSWGPFRCRVPKTLKSVLLLAAAVAHSCCWPA